ncbi:MAG: hypothetical protein HY205_04065, partial [Nitrospirae bacterium]|nr:hypothetical protein [Nitrospirota bacterium]
LKTASHLPVSSQSCCHREMGLAYLANRYLGRAAQEFIRLCRTLLLELGVEPGLADRPRVRSAG